MLSEDKYFQDLTKEELWQRYCGFLDLSVDEFMEIQRRLLMDEIDLVCDSLLGKKIMGNQKPRSIDEFRHFVPLTTYDDYEPYLSERRDDALSVKPITWIHSAGTGGRFKWIPHGPEIVDMMVKSYVACLILGSCQKKGEINIGPGLRFLIIIAPPPYTSGFVIPAFIQRFSSRLMPPAYEADRMEFPERMKKGIQMALKDGVDVIGALASVLAKMGETFGQQPGGMKLSPWMLHPKVLLRFMRAWLISKKERRAILPKDLWRLKNIFVSGLDTDLYKDAVVHYWGSVPFEVYAGTEALVYALQTWNGKGMVFLPEMAFFEFLPYEELNKMQENNNYQPATVLLNEVEEGKLYEVVISHFYGMPLLRYRTNDIIKVIAKRDEEAEINLPHVVFQRRVGAEIGLAGLARLDEKTIWQSIINTGIKHADWSACKEYDQNQVFLRLYIELKENLEAEEVARRLDEQLKVDDTDYKDIGSYLDYQPIRVTLLSQGTFRQYVEERLKEGADLAMLKPAHINPAPTIIQRLLELSESK